MCLKWQQDAPTTPCWLFVVFEGRAQFGEWSDQAGAHYTLPALMSAAKEKTNYNANIK